MVRRQQKCSKVETAASKVPLSGLEAARMQRSGGREKGTKEAVNMGMPTIIEYVG